MLKLIRYYFIPCLIFCSAANVSVQAQSDSDLFDTQVANASDEGGLFDEPPSNRPDDVGMFAEADPLDDSELPRYRSPRRLQQETGQDGRTQWVDPRNPNTSNHRGPYAVRQHARVVMEAQQRPLTEEERKRFGEVRELREKIRGEKDEKKRTELGETLRTKLGAIFDDDLSERDEQLKKLEARVAKLRAAVEKRRKNRDRVITLQVDSVMLAAEGLAFPAIQPEAATTRSGEWELNRPVPVQNAPHVRFGQPVLPPPGTTAPRNGFNRK